MHKFIVLHPKKLKTFKLLRNNINLRLKLLLLITILGLTYVCAYLFYFTYYKINLLYIGSNKDRTFKNELIDECNPMNEPYFMEQVEIDGNTYPKIDKYVPLHKQPHINFTCLNSKASNKIHKKICFWNDWLDFFKDYEYGLGYKEPFVKNNCPVTNCELINDNKRLDECDFVIVHAWASSSHAFVNKKKINLQIEKLLENFPFNSIRPLKQRWIFMQYEPPSSQPDYSFFNGFFNMTSSYLIDSDFPGFYESMSGLRWVDENPSFDDSFDYLQNKVSSGAAIISNCLGPSRTTSKRNEYLKELKKYIQIDLYGNCPNYKLCEVFTDANYKPQSFDGPCKNMIAQKYKFYFSFENSICKDYITEKFFTLLKLPIIPVVLGAGPYSRYIPKSGFINVEDYESPKSLAKYLNYLATNSTAYNSYFKWKKFAFFDTNNRTLFGPLCDMCIKLNLEKFYGIKKSIIQNLTNFYTKSQCKYV